MIVTLKPGADPKRVQGELTARGLWVQRLDGAGAPGSAIHFAVERHSRRIDPRDLLAIEGVADVAAPPSPHPRLDAQSPVVKIAGRHTSTLIGPGAPPVLMAGPCSIESEAQIRDIAAVLAPQGVRLLRGGAFKPRTSPYAFQGHGDSALGWMRKAADDHGLQMVTEVMGADEVAHVAELADLLQIGSRNMHNYALLKVVARSGRPVLLKRGMAATVEEWLLAGEYLLLHGAQAVIFCERGVRGFDPTTRNLLDLGAVALLSQVHRLPVVVDPSHGTGRRDLIVPLSRAALAAGASGLLVEVHPDPAVALSDGPQALEPRVIGELARAAATLSPPLEAAR